MKRRLRKKFHLGEFQEFGFHVEFALKDAASRDEVVEGFLSEAVEAHGLLAGGAIDAKGKACFHLASDRPRRTATEAHRATVEAWLTGNAHIAGFRVGPLEDAL